MGVFSQLSTRLKTALGTIPAGVPYGGPNRQWDNWTGSLPSTKVDYRQEAGDLNDSSAVQACIQWLTRTFPEAPLQVKRGLGDKSEVVAQHPLTTLLAKPNDYYSGILLWMATLASLTVSGNGYWLKVRSARGDLLELWYEPHFTIAPYWPQDGSVFIAGYRVNRAGKTYDVPRADVVHFRDGIDPQNPRLGLSRLASAYREVFTDNEAANYSASILRNMGIPGLVVSPADANGVIDNPADLKRDIMAKTTGDRRGEPLVMGLPTKIERIAWNPVEMNVRETRRIPEERVCALIGIPAVVVGLGAGLDRNTFSNARESREAAYESCIVPTQRLLAAELDVQVLPEVGDPATEGVHFDLTQVRALQEDRDKLVQRNATAYKFGLIRRSEGRRALGLETDANDEIFFTELPTIRETLTDALTAPIDVAQTELTSSKPTPEPSGTAKGLKRSRITVSAKPTEADVAGVAAAYTEWARANQNGLWPKE